MALEFHRIGGGGVENLTLKAKEAGLQPPGISLLQASSPAEAARQMRKAFPKAKKLHDLTNTVGSISSELIREAGFDIMHVPSTLFPNHYRLFHPQGAEGFNEENLQRLALAFVNNTGIES
jgi:hypothetical protein